MIFVIHCFRIEGFVLTSSQTPKRRSNPPPSGGCWGHRLTRPYISKRRNETLRSSLKTDYAVSLMRLVILSGSKIGLSQLQGMYNVLFLRDFNSFKLQFLITKKVIARKNASGRMRACLESPVDQRPSQEEQKKLVNTRGTPISSTCVP